MLDGKSVAPNTRPLSVGIISYIFIAVGSLGLAFHLSDWRLSNPTQGEIVWVSAIHLLAVICGLYMLRGSDWARWLAVTWIAFHVGVSIYHPLPELLIHALLLAIFSYFLFLPSSIWFFKLLSS
jgi:hypothetical protein